MLESGYDIRTVQELLGPADVSTGKPEPPAFAPSDTIKTRPRSSRRSPYSSGANQRAAAGSARPVRRAQSAS